MPEPITRNDPRKIRRAGEQLRNCHHACRNCAAVNTGLHTHPGFDAAYLLDGDLTVLERGQPAKPIRAGQSWHVRPGVVREVKAGDRPAKVLAMYVVEKGKPLATPWQPPPSN